jgi:hypothetical protein
MSDKSGQAQRQSSAVILYSELTKISWKDGESVQYSQAGSLFTPPVNKPEFLCTLC